MIYILAELVFYLLAFVICGAQASGAIVGTGSSSVIIPDAEEFRSSSFISFSAWIYITDASAPNVIASRSGNSVTFKPQWEFGVKTNCVRFSITKLGSTVFVWESSINSFTYTNSWHNIGFSFTYGSPDSAVCLIDGNLVAGSWIIGDGTGTPSTSNGEPAYLLRSADAQNVFLGYVSQTVIWNTIQNQMRLKNIAHSHLVFLPALNDGSLLCVYPLDGASGTIRDLAYPSHPGSPIGTLIHSAERVCSYPPNE